MAPDGDRGEGGRTASASERVYRALLRAYPEEVRRRYGEEMAGYFGDLCREESRRGGARGLALLWARTLPELVFTVIKERSTMLARDAYLPVSPHAVRRLGAISALVGGVLGTAYYLVLAISLPSGLVLNIWPVFYAAVLLSILGLVGLYGALAARADRAGRLAGAGAALAVVSAASWLAAGGYFALWPVDGRLSTIPFSGFGYVDRLLSVLLATSTLGWSVGLLLLGMAAFGARLPGRLRALPLAVAALLPASWLLVVLSRVGLAYGDGLNYSVIVLSALASSLPYLGTALLGRALLEGPDRLAVLGVIGGTVRRTTGAATRTAVPTRVRRSGARHAGADEEKELLEAIRRNGRITAAGAALETSLTVEEADRMLSGLASRGHLGVRAEHGGLFYSLWEGDG